MGEAKAEVARSYAPILELETIDANGESTNLDFEYQNIAITQELPDYSEREAPDYGSIFIPRSMTTVNVHFYRELAAYWQQRAGLLGVRFLLRNTGNNLADDVSIYVDIPISEDPQVITARRLLPKPKKKIDLLSIAGVDDFSDIPSTHTTLERYRNKITAAFHLGKLQTGDTVTTDRIYLVRPPQNLTKLDVRILSDQLRTPITLEIPVRIQADHIQLTLSSLTGQLEREEE